MEKDMKLSTKRGFLVVSVVVSAGIALGAGRSPEGDCPAEGVITPLAESSCATLTCMLVWPSEPSALEEDGPEGCHYQLAYSYELHSCADTALSLVSSTATSYLIAPGTTPDPILGAGSRGFLWLTDGDQEKLVSRSVATFMLGEQPLLEWRIVPD